MTWNYRIIRFPQPTPMSVEECPYYYEIHEVYYYKTGKPKMWSVDPIACHGCSVKELKADYKMMAEAFKQPILEVKKDKLVEVSKHAPPSQNTKG